MGALQVGIRNVESSITLGRTGLGARNVKDVDGAEKHLHDLNHASKLRWHAWVLTLQCLSARRARCRGGKSKNARKYTKHAARQWDIDQRKQAGKAASFVVPYLSSAAPRCGWATSHLTPQGTQVGANVANRGTHPVTHL